MTSGEIPNPFDTSTWTIRSVRANQLSFRIAVAGAGHPLVLCLHGFPESAMSWQRLGVSLAQAGYLVWAPDLRGYGGTDKPTEIDAYQIERLLDDVSGLLDAAHADRAILVGHDWGGIIAWYYAMRHPDRVDKLIVLNAPHPGCFERELRHWRQIRRSWYAGAFQLPWLPELVLTAWQGYGIGAIFRRMAWRVGSIPDDVVRLYRQQACVPGAMTAMVNYYRAAIRGGGAARQRRLGYPRITAPTLVFWGLHDHALTRHNLTGLDECVPNLSLHTLADAGHFVHYDRPEHVTGTILKWLQDTSSSRCNPPRGSM